MKIFSGIIFVIAVVFSFSSCAAAHSGLPQNVNNSITNVVLQSGNYEIVQRVEGTASGMLFIGLPLGSQTIVNNARSQMLQSANLIGSSRAIINETIEMEQAVFGPILRRTVTVSAHVIEWRD